MILDDVFDEEERDYKELKNAHNQIFKVALMLWLISSIIWTVYLLFKPSNSSLIDGSENIDLASSIINLILGIFILMTMLPSILAVILAIPINFIPYKSFSYADRFSRTYLLTLIVFFIGIILLGAYLIFES